MSVIKIEKDNFKAEVLESSKTVVLDFWASWCMPCQMLSPVIDEIAAERNDITVGKVNVDEQPELAQSFGIESIPTLLFIKNGTVFNKSVGVRSKEEIINLFTK